jgi:hypothetical protein
MPFDAAYYQRNYESRAHARQQVAQLARDVTFMVDRMGPPTETVLEVGAGTGYWRDWFARRRPGIRYRSIDVSPYACARYRHEQRDIARWRARGRFDLVLCVDVLPYLSNDEAESAMANLGAMTRRFMFLRAVTRRDVRELGGGSKLHPDLRTRTGAWYRQRLERHFVPAALGIWIRRSYDPPLFELELPYAGR